MITISTLYALFSISLFLVATLSGRDADSGTLYTLAVEKENRKEKIAINKCIPIRVPFAYLFNENWLRLL